MFFLGGICNCFFKVHWSSMLPLNRISDLWCPAGTDSRRPPGKFCLLRHCRESGGRDLCSILNRGLSSKPIFTHHADFEGVEEVKGQRGHQVDDEPRGQVMNANLPSIKNHLARLADVCGAEVENNICTKKKKNQQQRSRKVDFGLL